MVAGQPSLCTLWDKHGKADSWFQGSCRHLLTTQRLTGTLNLHRILIAHHKQILVKIQRVKSLRASEHFLLSKHLQTQSKWFWKWSLPCTRFYFPFTFPGISLLPPLGLGLTEYTPERTFLIWGVRLCKPHCICGISGGVVMRLAKLVHCFSAGQCFSFFCLFCFVGMKTHNTPRADDAWSTTKMKCNIKAKTFYNCFLTKTELESQWQSIEGYIHIDYNVAR